MTNKYTHVMWDWNGTLLDDAELCLDTINILLTNRCLPPIKNIDAYRDIFGFPVIDYYRRAGFDLDNEPFEIPAKEFIQMYHSDATKFRLFDAAEETLRAIKETGLKQAILSASELSNLRLQTSLLKVEPYFDDILGISNIYAGSKLDVGRAHISRADIGKAVLIGDTVHDYEVAAEMGVDCILISNGHQHRHTLLECGVPVLDDIKEIMEALS